MRIGLGQSSGSSFLEKFRYVIVASQPLSNHSKRTSFRLESLQTRTPLVEEPEKHESIESLTATPTGLLLIVVLNFVIVRFLKWFVEGVCLTPMTPQFALRVLLFASISAAGWFAFQQRRLWFLRLSVIEIASHMIASLDEFEANTAANLRVIQEVYLMSRGRRR